jgi:hypothetical protein
MSEQNEMTLNPTLMVESLDTLVKQLAFYEKEPIAHIAQTLVVMQTDLSKIKEGVVATKQIIQILRSSISLYSLPHRTESVANSSHTTKSGWIGDILPNPVEQVSQVAGPKITTSGPLKESIKKENENEKQVKSNGYGKEQNDCDDPFWGKSSWGKAKVKYNKNGQWQKI